MVVIDLECLPRHRRWRWDWQSSCPKRGRLREFRGPVDVLAVVMLRPAPWTRASDSDYEILAKY